jgi:XTP/dITP diphosphohydrolase
LRSLMKGVRVRVSSLAQYPDAPKVKETGETFEANARLKARAFSRHTKTLTLAEDSGLMVNALNGKPGVYSARFAGPGCSYEDNNRKLLKLLARKGTARRALTSRRAKFVCVVAIYDRGKFLKAVKGECAGRIAGVSRGKNGFGYDPVFIPDGFKKTFAELSRGSKNKISHRGKALRKAKQVILKYLGPR